MRRDDNVYARMLTPSDQVRRLRRVLDELVTLASVLDGRSRVVDGRVQLDLSALGPALKEQLGEPGWAKIAGKKNRDPPHPDRTSSRPARRWSLYDGYGERCIEGPLRALAGPCRRSGAAESRCRMATAHGVGKAPVAVHVDPSAAHSQTRAQLSNGSSRQRRGRSRVWIRETKVWGRKYEPIRDPERR